MDNTIQINIWNLFRQEFKDGEEVIIIHEDSELYGGKLTAYKDRCLIGSKEFPWQEIIFIAHSGFPCRALHTCLSNEELGDIENTASVILMRKLLVQKPEEKIITKEPICEPRPAYRSYGGGCPYEIQEVQMQIINLNSPDTGLLEYEETLLHRAKDGAVAMLWGLDDEIIEFYG